MYKTIPNINIIIKIFMYFQKLLLFNLFENILDKYPKEKKNKKEAIEAPIPK